jgi:putative phosphoribosyl transferase
MNRGITALFQDRQDAGRQLAQKLMQYAGQQDVVVLALPRGGLPVAYEVAKALRAPMDIFLVRKLGVPGHEELAMGAISSGGVRVLNSAVVEGLDIPERVIDAVARDEQKELDRREQLYRGDKPPVDIRGRTAILVDDGLATGASMQAAVAGLKAQEPKSIVVAVPTAATETCEAFEQQVSQVICVFTPQPFYGVGLWYKDFSQTTDEEVQSLLAESAQNRSNSGLNQ